ncbi:hypothetical protein B0A48_15904 [Cryoendolithus antarcticus]|uniref:Uncharacterized protein n=1 Tax=Cryoendolithus antarcticus TaxID=1507870 RepID=A0A1V8SFY8_9PEZI|nr:hypothetical protein B0A48_15904 [Cryoendolithus antarcticus]
MSPATAQPSSSTTTLPIIRKHRFPVPLLRLELRDLSHEGSSLFLRHFHGYEDFEQQVQNVLNLLYNRPTSEELSDSTSNDPTDTASKDSDLLLRPGTRSITMILQDYPGVAETDGIDLDPDHKTLRFSTAYIAARVKNNAAFDLRHEILGVVCHELVHCFQWNAEGTCNGGLIEGIADFVRLKAGLGAKHWKAPTRISEGESWDAGYERTAFFLEFVEGRVGEGAVRRLNAGLREGVYDERGLWEGVCGKKVGELWEQYGRDLERRAGGKGGDEDPPNPVPTHGVRVG